VMPSLLNVQRETKAAKLLQYGERVWDVRGATESARIDATIEKTRGFYESLGLRTRLADYDVKAETAAEVARRLRARGLLKIGERGDITPEVVERILRQAA
jgi:NADP-dependent alcohol dehydrogenase